MLTCVVALKYAWCCVLIMLGMHICHYSLLRFYELSFYDFLFTSFVYDTFSLEVKSRWLTATDAGGARDLGVFLEPQDGFDSRSRFHPYLTHVQIFGSKNDCSSNCTYLTMHAYGLPTIEWDWLDSDHKFEVVKSESFLLWFPTQVQT